MILGAVVFVRAGSHTAFANGPMLSDHCVPMDAYLIAMGWYCGNRTYVAGPAPVGLKYPNAWGLYDMHGNVAEWVWDGYRHDYQNLGPVDPVHDVGPGEARVLRGGYWYWYASFCRSAKRGSAEPGVVYGQLGLRPVRTVLTGP